MRYFIYKLYTFSKLIIRTSTFKYSLASRANAKA